MMRIVRLSLAVCLALFADVFASIKFLGVKSGYRYGDTWYPTWAENDTLYSPCTGGRIGLNLGMIASSSWNARGDWIGEADASKVLLSTNQVVTGPSKKTNKIKRPVGRRVVTEKCLLISSVAIPYSESKEIDYASDRTFILGEFTSEDRSIEWEVPSVQVPVISEKF